MSASETPGLNGHLYINLKVRCKPRPTTHFQVYISSGLIRGVAFAFGSLAHAITFVPVGDLKNGLSDRSGISMRSHGGLLPVPYPLKKQRRRNGKSAQISQQPETIDIR